MKLWEAERAKAEKNAVRVRKGRRAGTGMVHGNKKNRRTAATVWRYAAFRKTQPDTMLSLTERPPKRKEKLEGVLFEKIRIQVLR